jgi:hypothetical protein
MPYIKKADRIKSSDALESSASTEDQEQSQTPVVSSTPTNRRRVRPIINGLRDVLSVKNKEPGYVYRIFNSNTAKDLARIETYKEYGYEPVTHPIDVGDRTANTGSRIGTANISTGGGTNGVVMRIPKEYYDEDQRAKQLAILQTERATKDKASHRDVDFGSVEIKNT